MSATVLSSKASTAVHRQPFSTRVAGARPGRCLSVVASAQPQAATRRELLGASAAFSLLLAANPAQAFLGFGEDGNLQTVYTSETSSILTKVKDTLALDKDDPAKEDKVKDLRKDINQWVAKYRREPKVSGRPSFGNTYSALNALAGHFNSFGTTAPIPKKRLDRLQKELDDAALLLTRNR